MSRFSAFKNDDRAKRAHTITKVTSVTLDMVYLASKIFGADLQTQQDLNGWGIFVKLANIAAAAKACESDSYINPGGAGWTDSELLTGANSLKT